MASYYNNDTVVYLNGEIVKASEAKMDLYSQSLHYGYSVFEGIRSYKTVNGETKIFKPIEHYDRLKNYIHEHRLRPHLVCNVKQPLQYYRTKNR